MKHGRKGQHSIRINEQWRVGFNWTGDGAADAEIVDCHWTRKLMRHVAPVSPGEMLEMGFLKPLGLAKYRLAKGLCVPPQRMGDNVSGNCSITAGTDLRLYRYFGRSDGWWLRGQASYDTAITKQSMQDALSRSQPCALLAS
jgi:addiction module HigA family antidote